MLANSPRETPDGLHLTTEMLILRGTETCSGWGVGVGRMGVEAGDGVRGGGWIFAKQFRLPSKKGCTLKTKNWFFSEGSQFLF